MKVFYSRVSTVKQNEERQLSDTDSFDKVFIDKCSGTIPLFERPKGQQIATLLDSGDLKTLEVHSIDRLGRSTVDVLKMWQLFTDKGITLICRNPMLRNFNDQGKPDQVSEMIVAILSTMAKFENELRKERQAEGIAIAKLEGKYKGRKVNTVESDEAFLNKDKSKQILKLLDKKRTYSEISKIAGCSSSTIRKTIKLNNKRKLDS